MADFCFQCNIDLCFGPHEDFGLQDRGPPPRDHGYLVLCEGCGPTLVDEKGRCLGECEAHQPHRNPDGSLPEVYRDAEMWLARRSGPLRWLYRLRDRLLGTPWDPGILHEVRWRWYSFKEWLSPSSRVADFIIDEVSPKHLETVFFGGINAAAQGTGTPEAADRDTEGPEHGEDGPDNAGVPRRETD